MWSRCGWETSSSTSAHLPEPSQAGQGICIEQGFQLGPGHQAGGYGPTVPLQSPITLTSRNGPRENDQTHAVLGAPGTLCAQVAPLCTRLKWQQERPEAHSYGSSALGWGVQLGGHSSLLLGGDLPMRRPMGGALGHTAHPRHPS